MKQQKTTALALMLRAPQIGKIKTRLATKLGEKNTLQLYKYMVEDIYEQIAYTQADLILSVEPADQIMLVKNWLQPAHAQEQIQGDLGEKMHHCIDILLTKGWANVIVIGSDIPSLSKKILNQAIEMLEDNCVDTIIGPAGDGGYYLIGFNQQSYNKSIFESIDWGSPNVYNQTMTKLDGLANQTGILPTLNDIDTFEDLKNIKEECIQYNSGERTLSYLKKLKIF